MEDVTRSEINSAKATFLAWERTSRDTIDFKRIYVDICDDLISGLVLSQIIYWHLPDANGKTKLRINHNGELWIAKTRREWWDEIRVGPRQLDRALVILEKHSLVETAVYRFNGSPTKHIRLIYETLLPGINNLSINPPKNPYLLLDGTENGNNESGISPIGDMDMSDSVKSLTESTAETTSTLDSGDSLQDLDSETILSFAKNAKENNEATPMATDSDLLLQSASDSSKVIAADFPKPMEHKEEIAGAKNEAKAASEGEVRKFHSQAQVGASPFPKVGQAKPPVVAPPAKPAIHSDSASDAIREELARGRAIEIAKAANPVKTAPPVVTKYYPVNREKRQIGPAYTSKCEADSKAEVLAKHGFEIVPSTVIDADPIYQSYTHTDGKAKTAKARKFGKATDYAVNHAKRNIATGGKTAREWKKIKDEPEWEGYELIKGAALEADAKYQQYEYNPPKRQPMPLWDAIEKQCGLTGKASEIGQFINWLADRENITVPDAKESKELAKQVEDCIKWNASDRKLATPQHLTGFSNTWNAWKLTLEKPQSEIPDNFMPGVFGNG